MSETTVGKLNVSIGITVDYPTAEICLRLLENILMPMKRKGCVLTAMRARIGTYQ